MPRSESGSEGAEESEMGGSSLLHKMRPPARGVIGLSLPGMSAFHAGVCVLLSLQNSSYVLLRRYSSGVLREPASSAAILAVGEMIKMTFSWWMILREAPGAGAKAGLELEGGGRTHGAGGVRWLYETSARLLLSSAVMAVPALIFLAMNLLSFVALERISASSFTLIQQTKIIFTALLSRLLLATVLSPARWRALLTLLFSVLVICHQTQPHPDCAAGGPGADAAAAQNMQAVVAADAAAAASEVAWQTYAVGVAAVTAEATLSGLSNVYFERVIKSTSLSLWERNVQLAGFSLLIYLPMAAHAHPSDMLYGWSAITVVVAFLGALGGILIGLVLKYCDSIIKNLALSTAIITTAFLDHLVFHGPMNLPIIAAAATVITSIINYTEAH